MLVAVTVLTYWNSLSTPFQFDDFSAVGNTTAQQARPEAGAAQPGVLVAGRPIVRFSFALNYTWGGHAVTGYHVFNLAVHIVCALLFFALVLNTVEGWGPVDWRPNAFGVAYWSALIWALHPLNTGEVTYISARSESLMAMCYLATLLASMRAHDPRHRRLSSALAVIFCALGMATKEAMVTAPFLVVLLDRAFVFSSFRQAFVERGRLYAALAGTWTILAALLLTGARSESVGFSLGVSSWTYLLNQAAVLTDYLRRSLWPYPLVFAYGEPRALVLRDVWPEAVLILTLAALACWSRLKAPRIGFLALAFFLVLAPTSSVVPIATEVGAERRMYLPLMALTVLVVLFGRSIWRATTSRIDAGNDGTTAPGRWWWRPGVAVPIGVCVLLAGLTMQRNSEYATGEGLWRATLDRWPSVIAHRNLATSLLQTGHGREAIEQLRLVAGERPKERYALGLTLFEQGRFNDALVELRAFLDRSAVAGSDAEANARVVAAISLDRLGRAHDAQDLLQELLRRRSDYAPAHLAIGDVYLHVGAFADAQQSYRRYLMSEPADEGALTNLGIAAIKAGDLEETIRVLQRVVDAQPQHASAHRNLAVALHGAGRVDEAIAHVEEAARLAPADAATQELAQRLRTGRSVIR
jgi:Flp pilus assembly protein TadD